MLISLWALVLGAGIDLLVGDPHGWPHPVVGIGKLISRGERVLRQIFPKTPGGELAAGGVLVAVVLLCSGGIPWLLLHLAERISGWLRLALESVMCWQELAGRSLRDESMAVHRALKGGDLAQSRRAVSMIVGRDVERLDGAGVTRAAVETVAENASDGVIAPLFYCLLGGAWLGFVYKGINTMDSMIAYRSERYLYFGRVAARLDDAANFLPSRLAGLAMVPAAALTGLSASGALRIWRRDRRKHDSPNSAQTESACAGALGVRLAGDAWYGGVRHQKEYIGDDLRPIELEDIPRSCRLMFAAAGLVLILGTAGKAALIFALGGALC